MKKVTLSKLNNELLQSKELDNIQKQQIKGGDLSLFRERRMHNGRPFMYQRWEEDN